MSDATDDIVPPVRSSDSVSDLIERILGDCLEGAPETWAPRLEQACEVHPELAAGLTHRFDALLRVLPDSATASFWRSPTTLGDFDLGEPLGSGGMGVVYRARQRSLDREVAIKTIRAERAMDPAAHERFRREAAAVAQLEHPHILKVYAFGNENGLPWFAMALHGGATLATVLDRVAGRDPDSLTGADLAEAVGKRVDAHETDVALFHCSWAAACVALAAQIARALEHAHGRGVLHRDVKPSNVMLGQDGQAVLIDFGLTGSVDPRGEEERLTRTGTALGTLVYMAPEQILAREAASPLVDVYSLGATLSELLTLQPPFSGDSAAALESAVLRGRVEGLRDRNRRISADLETVVQKAMARRPIDRYRSASELALDLERILERRPISARPAGPFVRLRRWAQRRPAEALAVWLGGVAVFGIPASMWLTERRAKVRVETALSQSLESKVAADDARRAAEQALARERAALNEAQESAASMRAAASAAMASETESAEVLGFLLHLFDDLPPLESVQAPPTARDLLERGAQAIDANAEMPASARARVQLALGTSFRHGNDYPRALELIRAAITTFESGSSEASRERLAYALDGEARCLMVLGRFQEAIAAAHRARDLALELYANDSAQLSSYLQLAAEVYTGTDLGEEGLARSRQLLAHLEKHRPSAEVEIARARGLLAQFYLATGRQLQARTEFDAALGVMRRALPENDLGRIQTTLRSANVPLITGDISAAMKLFREGRDLAMAAFGPDDELTLAAEASLADALFRGHDPAAAVEAYERILPRMRTRYGESNMYGTTIVAFLRALTAQGRSKDLVRWATENDWSGSLAKIFGKGHHEYGFAHRWLAGCALGVGDFETGVAALEEVIEFARRNPSAAAEHQRALMTIGQLYAGPLQDDARALDAFEDARELIGDALVFYSTGPDTPQVELGLAVLDELVRVAERAGEADRAAALTSEAAVRQKRVQAAEDDGLSPE